MKSRTDKGVATYSSAICTKALLGKFIEIGNVERSFKSKA